MVCLPTQFLGPNSSHVVSALMAFKAPEQVPKIAVLMYKLLLLSMSMKTAMGMGIIRSTVNAGLGIIDFSL